MKPMAFFLLVATLFGCGKPNNEQQRPAPIKPTQPQAQVQLQNRAQVEITPSCDFIANAEFSNGAKCWFADSAATTVIIKPHQKITATMAASWIYHTSTTLQLAGYHSLTEITVFTSPNMRGEYVTAKSSGDATVMQERKIIHSLTKICITPNDWSDIVGADGKPGRPHKCKPFKP